MWMVKYIVITLALFFDRCSPSIGSVGSTYTDVGNVFDEGAKCTTVRFAVAGGGDVF
jgi:hypothetical protein